MTCDVYLVLDNSGGSDVKLGYKQKLCIQFNVPGCFTNSDPDSFHPKLPSGYFAVGTIGPYTPKKKDHDDVYDFEPNQQCQETKEEYGTEHEHEKAEPERRRRRLGMHTIHIGS